MPNYYINPGLSDVKQYNGRTLPSNINIVKKEISPLAIETNSEAFNTGYIETIEVVENSPSDTTNSINSYNAKKGGLYYISDAVSYATTKQADHKKVDQFVQGKSATESICADDCASIGVPPIAQSPEEPPLGGNWKLPILSDTFGCATATFLSIIAGQLIDSNIGFEYGLFC